MFVTAGTTATFRRDFSTFRRALVLVAAPDGPHPAAPAAAAAASANPAVSAVRRETDVTF
jgi:hypothetical protein